MKHNTFLVILFFLIIATFGLFIFTIPSPENSVEYLFIFVLVALIAMLVYYFKINIINPLQYFERTAKTSKNMQLDNINDVKFDQLDAVGYIVEKSLESITTLTNQITNATKFVQAIENGKLDFEYQSIGEFDQDPLEIALKSMRNQMSEIAEDEKERMWATEGLAKFADILRINTGKITDLYDNIIRNVVKYTSANQGGLYVIEQENEKDAYIDLVAYYAFERKKYIAQRFEITEGLLGQSYLEKDMLMLTEVPDNYSSITSGTGSATPKCVVIIPLAINDIIYGMLEIATFSQFKPHQVDFLKKLSENIASTVANVKINERTKLLLEDSQISAELMRSQEEEMRQNMEELHATQEEMQRNEKVHLLEIDRLRDLHEENLKEAEQKNEDLKRAETETKELMSEIQSSQEEISKNYAILFDKFIGFNIKSKFDQLTSIRSTKKKNIEDYFENIRNQILTYSEDKMIVDAMKAFKVAFQELGQNIEEKKLLHMKQHVEEYYQNEFLPKLNANSDRQENLEQYWDNASRTILMQYQYISNNVNETGKKHLLDSADESCKYSQIHQLYHPIIRNFLLTFGYYDIFLIDNETGHIIYSVFKEVDYTTSLLTGPYKNTNFANVFRQARNAQRNEFVKLVDFEPYNPSYTAPASFIATPIFDGAQKIGVLVFQMPIDKINSIMTGDRRWNEDGLGTSGETYLVGEDYKMRSISRFLIEDPTGYFNELERIGYNEYIIRKIKKLNTTILLQDVKTDAVINALRGNSDKKIVLDYRNISVLSAYAKLKIEDVNWVICSDIDEAEVVEGIAHMKEMAII